MPIVSSIIETDRAQAGGRRKIVEVHTDHVGGRHLRRYLALAGDNVSAGLAAAAATIETQLRDGELDRLLDVIEALGAAAVIAFVHATAAQLRTAMRARFRLAKGIILANLAAFCLTLTNAQLQSLFGVAAGAKTTDLRSRLQAKVDKRDALLAEVGE